VIFVNLTLTLSLERRGKKEPFLLKEGIKERLSKYKMK